jgi:hypothetical protein
MRKKILCIFSMAIFIFIGLRSALSKDAGSRGTIKRLTFSGNDSVLYPCLDDDGKCMLYVLEVKEGEQITRVLRMLEIETGKETELFRDKTMKGPEPFKDIPLLLGSKPPRLSGNGLIAVFTLSLDQPANILDHYLAVVRTDSTDLRIYSFPMEPLKGVDYKKFEFTTSEWERVSNYALSSNGERIVCALKGHSGPIRYGNASALVLLDTGRDSQLTILAPDFDGKGWKWKSPPYRPLTGGGWALGINGSGERIIFGAQSSDDATDYDLYLCDREGKKTERITDFHDRWFSLAELSQDGEKVVFLYTGKKEHGIGTYVMNIDESELEYLEPQVSPRMEFCDLSGNGQYILFKSIYRGFLFDLKTNKATLAFDENTPGYVSGEIPMDFPPYPAFWCPGLMSQDGKRILLVGPPEGKGNAEIYLLSFEEVP